jgi:hypothetical protein
MLNRSAIILFLLFLIIGTSTQSQTPSPKRGLAYGYNSLQDIQSLSKGVSWWYNWSHQPENTALNIYQDYPYDFVPMAWNGSFNKTALRSFLSTHPNVKYILGWNEPNFTSQANMAPAVAATKWKDIEAIADEFNLKIVGPAVNYCDKCVTVNGTPITDPVAYLDSFFLHCPDCRVDYIAVHNYMGTVSALQWYIGLFKKYKKPIWLTEFANWENNPTLQQQKSYLISAVDYLESDSSVFRYAWFTGRYTGAPYIALLENAKPGVLTELGKIYVNMPVHDTSFYVPVPARIEAEAYTFMKGVSLEATSDTSGYANVGHIDVNDWFEYNVLVPQDTTYNLDLRVAGTTQSSIDILVNGTAQANFIFPSSGGWQSWKSFKTTIRLSQGKQKIRLLVKKAGFNINWIRFYLDSPSAVGSPFISNIRVYPNPMQDVLSVEGLAPDDETDLLDILGHSYKLAGSADKLDTKVLPEGIFILRVKHANGSIESIRLTKIRD